jgi:hypothetical protein
MTVDNEKVMVTSLKAAWGGTDAYTYWKWLYAVFGSVNALNGAFLNYWMEVIVEDVKF